MKAQRWMLLRATNPCFLKDPGVQFNYRYINITSKNLLADYYDFFKAAI